MLPVVEVVYHNLCNRMQCLFAFSAHLMNNLYLDGWGAPGDTGRGSDGDVGDHPVLFLIMDGIPRSYLMGTRGRMGTVAAAYETRNIAQTRQVKPPSEVLFTPGAGGHWWPIFAGVGSCAVVGGRK